MCLLRKSQKLYFSYKMRENKQIVFLWKTIELNEDIKRAQKEIRDFKRRVRLSEGKPHTCDKLGLYLKIWTNIIDFHY